MATDEIIELDAGSTDCKICENAAGKYVCPRCNVMYCSLDCYRSAEHSSCSEDFYKENMLGELSMIESDAKSRDKIQRVLKNLHENDEHDCCAEESVENDSLDSDDEGGVVPYLAERLAHVDLDSPEEIVGKLTSEELNDVLKLLKSSTYATKLVPRWEPWWTFHSTKSMVVEQFDKTNCPLVDNVEHLKELCKQEPPISVERNLVNILAGYCFTVRFSNGEHLDFPQETASLMGRISLSLRRHQDFPDHESALRSVEGECRKQEWVEGDEGNFAAMKRDVADILRGPNRFEDKFYVLAVLCDLRRLLKRCLDAAKMMPEPGSNN